MTTKICFFNWADFNNMYEMGYVTRYMANYIAQNCKGDSISIWDTQMEAAFLDRVAEYMNRHEKIVWIEGQIAEETKAQFIASLNEDELKAINMCLGILIGQGRLELCCAFKSDEAENGTDELVENKRWICYTFLERVQAELNKIVVGLTGLKMSEATLFSDEFLQSLTRDEREMLMPCTLKMVLAGAIEFADARKEAKRLKAEIASGVNPKGEPKKVTLTYDSFFTEHYLPYVTPRKRSWKRDEELYRLRIKKVFGDKKLDAITRQEVQSFHTALLAEGLAPASADHHVKLIRQSLNLAIEWDMLEKNPAAKVPLFNVDNKVEHYLDDEQLGRLLAVLRDPDSPRSVCQIALFLLSTGARLNEALTATWSQIDRHTRVWRIPAAVSKSGKIRVVPLNDSALEILGELKTEGKFEHLFVNTRISTKTGEEVGTGKPYTTIMKVWSRLRLKAGLWLQYGLSDSHSQGCRSDTDPDVVAGLIERVGGRGRCERRVEVEGKLLFETRQPQSSLPRTSPYAAMRVPNLLSS